MSREEIAADSPKMSDEKSSRVPDFFIIGSMKSGTTTLHAHLARHPSVFMISPKEPQFFSRDHVYKKGEAWYRSLYADAAPEQIIGEASTCYSRWPAYPDAVSRIHAFAPGSRLLYIMRHPVERAYSHYTHVMTENFVRRKEILTFDAFLETDEEAVCAGQYMTQIERYLAYFPREQLMLLLLDDLRSNLTETMNSVCHFLGIDPGALAEADLELRNEKGYTLGKYTAKKSMQRLRETPVISPLIGLIPTGLRRKARIKLTRLVAEPLQRSLKWKGLKSSLTPLTPASRKRVLDLYREQSKALEGYLGRSIPSWYE